MMFGPLHIQGARSALLTVQREQRAGQSLTYLQCWAMEETRERHSQQPA